MTHFLTEKLKSQETINSEEKLGMIVLSIKRETHLVYFGFFVKLNFKLINEILDLKTVH